MKSLKVKLVSIVSAFILALSLLIVGVWAVGEAQHINLSGSVNFTISDNTLYIKDIRVRDEGDLTGQGTTIDNFLPGFVNGDIDLDLGERTADTSFTLLFDVINTTTTEYKASTVSTIPNATLSVSGIIAGDGIEPSAITNSTPISGTIVMTVTVQSAGTVSLDGIVIDIEENTGYTVTVYYDGGDGEANVAINDMQEFLRPTSGEIEGSENLNPSLSESSFSWHYRFYNVKRIAFGGFKSSLQRAVLSYTLTVTSDSGINESLYVGNTGVENGEFLGWYEITADTVFNLVMTRELN